MQSVLTRTQKTGPDVRAARTSLIDKYEMRMSISRNAAHDISTSLFDTTYEIIELMLRDFDNQQRRGKYGK